MPDPLKGKASLAGLVGKSNANAAELPTRSLGTVTNSARYLNISSSVRQLSYCFTKVGRTAAIQLNYWEKFNSELPHKKKERVTWKKSIGGQRLEAIFTRGDLISTQVAWTRDGQC